MRRYLFVLTSTALLWSCGGGGGSPASPSAPIAPTPAPGGTTSGQVTDVFTSSGIGSVLVSGSGVSGGSGDASGRFELRSDAGGTYAVTVSAPSYIERKTRIKVPGALATISLIPSSFDMTTFDQMCRSFQGRMARWVDRPKLVIQRNLIDWSSTNQRTALAESLSDEDVACMEARVRTAVSQMSGGALEIASVSVVSAQPGAAVQLSASGNGTITVAGAKNLDAAGRGSWLFGADMAITSGWAIFIAGRSDPSLPNTYQTRCNSPQILTSHEIGHVMGYQHVTTRFSIMAEPPLYRDFTDFDAQAVALVYRRSPGNSSPDVDAASISANFFGSNTGSLK